MNIFIIIAALFLSSCSLFQPLPPKVVVSTKLIYPAVPNFNAPPKGELEAVKFDWPRHSNIFSIRNTSKCKLKFKKLYPHEDPISFRFNVDDYVSAFKLEKNTDFWYGCSVKSIELDSNLYIGLDELNYKKLVNNDKLFIMREKQWRNLLNSMNDLLKTWRDKGAAK